MTPSQKFSKVFTQLSFEISLEGCVYCTFITKKTKFFTKKVFLVLQFQQILEIKE